MATRMQYVTEEELRHECWNVSEADYEKYELEKVGSRSEVQFHTDVGRSLSAPFTSSDDVYESVRNAVFAYSKWIVGSTADEWKDEADVALKEYKRIVESINAATGTGSTRKYSTVGTGPWLGRAV